MIDRLKADFPISYLCEKLGASPAGYYAWRNRPISNRGQRRWSLTAQVLGLFVASERADGHRKITASLHAAGVKANRKTVASTMQGLGIMPPSAEAAFRKAATRARATEDPKDLLERDFSSHVEPGKVTVGDITYVATSEGWVHVATVIDLASRKVLGWASGKRQTADLVIRAMRNAIATGLVSEGSIFHSDHGIQYRSKKFSRFCAKHGIRRSMGARFECWDNAVAESFFSKMKSERLNWLKFTTRAAAIYEVGRYIRHFNQKRRHQTLGYATPDESLARLTRLAPPAATNPVAA
jgi:putative transposase